MPISKKQIFDEKKKSKNPLKIQNCSQKKTSEWFGPKTSETIGFHENDVIIQRQLRF